MKIINSLVGQLLDPGSMRLNLDIVETDRLGTLAIDVALRYSISPTLWILMTSAGAPLSITRCPGRIG